MSKKWHIPRRTFLRGVGTAISLPLLDAMIPSATAKAVTKKTAAPRRMVFIFVPNGAHMPDWTPAAVGSKYEMPPILKSLQPHRKEITVYSGLAHDKAKANGDGAGDHARSVATFLTARQAKKTHGADIKIGVSVDQIAAAQIGKNTKFPSLELGCERGATSGSCDSGYSCAYSSNMSWRTENQPMPKEVDPRLVFERLFGNGAVSQVAKSQAKRLQYNKSILDFALEDANQLRRTLGAGDKKKLDEYLYAIRATERKIAKAELLDKQGKPNIAKPTGIPNSYAQHLRIMSDLVVLALQSDMTRIVTFMYANAGSNRSYSTIGVPEGHHTLSHHGRNKEKQKKISKINQFHSRQFAYFLDQMKSIKEADGTLLDHSMVLYGSGIGDGDRHNHNDLPILLAGSGGGSLPTGKHVRYPGNTPLANLYLSMLDRMDVKAKNFGDSNKRLLDRE